MSTVYLAVQESLGRMVALKVLKHLESPQQAERFLHEARIIASLDHRNIITIHDVGVVDDCYYIAMEYLEGGSLGDRIDHGLPPPEALALLEAMTACLDFVHRRGIVHRDIKPSNILFHSDGTPKLTDFGIAKLLEDDQEITLHGIAVGSPYYLSPEQAEGKPLDGRSDIYGLGIVFYQMLTGHRPYAEKSHVETIVAHLSQPIPMLPDRYAAYQGLLERMIAKAPEQRIDSANDLLAIIRDLRAKESSVGRRAARGITAQESPQPGKGPYPHERDWRRRNGRVLVLGVLLIAAAGVHWLLSGDTPPAARVTGTMADTEDYGGEPPTAAAPALRTAGRIAAVAPVAVSTAASVEHRPETMATPLAEPLTDAGDTGGIAPESPVAPLMQAAEEALRENRLTRPQDDNAVGFYRQVIAIEPGHPGARAGIDRVADRYAYLAGKAIDRGDDAAAGRYIARGLGVRADHAHLLMLREKLARRARPSEPPSPVVVAQEPDTPVNPPLRGEGSGDIVGDFRKVWRSVFD